MPRQSLQRLFQLPVAHPLLESAVAGLVRRILLRHLAPLCPGTQNPKHSVQHSPGLVPRATAIVRSPRWPQHRLHHGPLFIVQFPASCHGASRLFQSSPRIAQNNPSGIYETGSNVLPRRARDFVPSFSDHHDAKMPNTAASKVQPQRHPSQMLADARNDEILTCSAV